jgi:uncharacterized lipoprotein YbaY
MTLLPVLAAAATFCLTWHGAYAADVKFSGSAFYRERIALPPDATLLVEAATHSGVASTLKALR